MISSGSGSYTNLSSTCWCFFGLCGTLRITGYIGTMPADFSLNTRIYRGFLVFMSLVEA